MYTSDDVLLQRHSPAWLQNTVKPAILHAKATLHVQQSIRPGTEHQVAVHGLRPILSSLCACPKAACLQLLPMCAVMHCSEMQVVFRQQTWICIQSQPTYAFDTKLDHSCVIGI